MDSDLSEAELISILVQLAVLEVTVPAGDRGREGGQEAEGEVGEGGETGWAVGHQVEESCPQLQSY